VREINVEKAQQYLGEYAELKERLVNRAMILGALGTAVCAAIGGLDMAVSYSTGAATGAYYLVLLGKVVPPA
jgi:hypothetical protein